MANSYDFSVIQGSSFIVYLNATNSDGTPINLSGYSAIGYVKNQYFDMSVLFNLNPTPILPYESGIILVSGNSTSTVTLPAGSYLYNIDITNGNNSLQVLNGDFDVYASTIIYQPISGFGTGIIN